MAHDENTGSYSPKPRGWKGTDKTFTMKRTLDGHIQPYYTEVEVDGEDYDPSNPHYVE